MRIENVHGAPTYICDARGMKKGLAVVPGMIGLVMLSFAVIVPSNTLPGLVKDVLKKSEGWFNLFRFIPFVMVIGICLFMGILGLFGLLFLFIGLHGLVSRRTWIREGMIHQHMRLFGIPWTRRCPCAGVTGVNTGDTSSSGGKTWYDVVIERNTESRFGRMPWLYLFSRITVATGVPTQREAEEISSRLRQDLRLTASAGRSALGQNAEMDEATGGLIMETQQQVEALLMKPVGYFMTLDRSGKNEVIQVAHEAEGGKASLKVLIGYPFSEPADKALGKVGVAVPTGWKLVQFEDGTSVTYDATGSDAVTIAAFLDAVFAKLLKWQPDSFAIEKL